MKPNSNEIHRYIIKLQKKVDTHGKTYFMGVVQDSALELDLSKDGLVFFVFTSKEGAEELHIGKNEHIAPQHQREENYISGNQPEVIRRPGSGENYRSNDSSEYEAVPRRRAAVGY